MEDETKLVSDEYPVSPADPQVIPQSTFWPITLAFGVMFIIWGLITSLIITGVGLLLSAFAIVGWINDMNDEG